MYNKYMQKKQTSSITIFSRETLPFVNNYKNKTKSSVLDCYFRKDYNIEKYFEYYSSKDLLIIEDNKLYQQFNQFNNSKKSFHLSAYHFSSNFQKEFFDVNLFNNNSIKHIWFTGMDVNSDFNFYMYYFDSTSKTKVFYIPDFLIETIDSKFFVIEINHNYCTEDNIISAKKEAIASFCFVLDDKSNEYKYIKNIRYVFVPSNMSNALFQEV